MNEHGIFVLMPCFIGLLGDLCMHAQYNQTCSQGSEDFLHANVCLLVMASKIKITSEIRAFHEKNNHICKVMRKTEDCKSL